MFENKSEQAGFAVPHSSLTIGLVGVGLGLGWGKNFGPEKNSGPEKIYAVGWVGGG